MTSPVEYLKHFLFPPKCILCRRVLENNETDLCRTCRATAPEYSKGNLNIPFIDSTVAVWYYKGSVRQSLIRYKFRRARFLAEPFGRFLAMKVLTSETGDLDLVTWVPVSPLRKLLRGYDQDELVAQVVARELALPCVPLLKKIRHNRPQSSIGDYASRKANVMGVYSVVNADWIPGAKVLLVDDILTTGATAEECARELRNRGAEEIHCAVIATAHHNKS